MEQLQQLEENLKSARNLADISLLVLRMGKIDLLPTVLELLHEQTQQIVDEYCIEGMEDAR